MFAFLLRVYVSVRSIQILNNEICIQEYFLSLSQATKVPWQKALEWEMREGYREELQQKLKSGSTTCFA